MADMLAYRIGMLWNLNSTLQGRALEQGIEYHPATTFEIRGLAELSMTVCPNRDDFARWKDGYSGKEFPTRTQMEQEFSKEYAARRVQQFLDRLDDLDNSGVSTQKQATAAYQQNNRPRAESKGV